MGIKQRTKVRVKELEDAIIVLYLNDILNIKQRAMLLKRVSKKLKIN